MPVSGVTDCVDGDAVAGALGDAAVELADAGFSGTRSSAGLHATEETTANATVAVRATANGRYILI